jgi:hypothetical protein
MTKVCSFVSLTGRVILESTYRVTRGWHAHRTQLQESEMGTVFPQSKSDSAKKERPTLIVRNA